MYIISNRSEDGTRYLYTGQDSTDRPMFLAFDQFADGESAYIFSTFSKAAVVSRLLNRQDYETTIHEVNTKPVVF